jgi:hypothetical protein
VKDKGVPMLEMLLALYVGASLFHFTHNAEFVDAYPNLPHWITRSNVYLTWLAITAVGLAGYVLLRLGKRMVGLAILCLYAAAGLDGLLHYTRAPIHAHTHGMNATIWFEALAAAMLLLYLFATTRRQLRR